MNSNVRTGILQADIWIARPTSALLFFLVLPSSPASERVRFGEGVDSGGGGGGAGGGGGPVIGDGEVVCVEGSEGGSDGRAADESEGGSEGQTAGGDGDGERDEQGEGEGADMGAGVEMPKKSVGLRKLL